VLASCASRKLYSSLANRTCLTRKPSHHYIALNTEAHGDREFDMASQQHNVPLRAIGYQVATRNVDSTGVGTQAPPTSNSGASSSVPPHQGQSTTNASAAVFGQAAVTVDDDVLEAADLTQRRPARWVRCRHYIWKEIKSMSHLQWLILMVLAAVGIPWAYRSYLLARWTARLNYIQECRVILVSGYNPFLRALS
jgi:hypothetical protein